MRRLAIAILILLLVLITGIGCNGEISSDQQKEKFEYFSFAVITDLHIGYCIPDYYPDYPTEVGKDWFDGIQGNPGENDNQAEILQGVVERIIEEKDRFNIKFVVVLGDISDTAERSEFLRAREILNQLNDVGIPYLPLMGNHDTWPYTQPEEESCSREKQATIADYALGDKFFEDIFWGETNNRNIQLIKSLFGDSWQKGKNPINDLSRTNHSVYLQNYGFSYGRITFVALDLAPRAENDPNPRNGEAYPGSIKGAIATDHKQTIEFSQYYTQNHVSERNIAILFSHYPLGFDGMVRYVILKEYRWIYNFAGHQHTTEVQRPDASKFEILTEDIGEISFSLTNRTGKPIRIVQVKEDSIDYSILLSKKSLISSTPAPTVTSTSTPTITCPPEGKPKFAISQEVVTTDALKVRENPGLTFPEIKTEPRETSGKILEGPVCQDDYIWWKVKYQDGIIGWSAQDWLGVKESQFQRSYLCDFSQPVPLRETTEYGIFGTDAFDTVVCGYLKLKDEFVSQYQQTNAYFVIVDFLHEGLIKSIEREIQIGNTVNIKESGSYLFNLGCFREAGIITGAEMDPQTHQAILDSSPENLVSLVLSFEKHPGYGCDCCNLASRISLYMPPPPATPVVDVTKAKENALSHAIETNPRGDMLLVDNTGYQIIYFTKEDQFLISIKKSPFEKWRQEAEQEFLRITEAEKYIACKLVVIITTPQFANPTEAGKNFFLSFCQ